MVTVCKLETILLIISVLFNVGILVMILRMHRHKKLYDHVVDAVVKELLPAWRGKKEVISNERNCGLGSFRNS